VESTEKAVPMSDSFSCEPNTLVTRHVIVGVAFELRRLCVVATGRDPCERGCKVELFYEDSNATEHIIERVYAQSGSQWEGVYATTQARDLTPMVGGGGAKIIVRQQWLSRGHSRLVTTFINRVQPAENVSLLSIRRKVRESGAKCLKVVRNV
jgi:hypothetical protein